VLNEKLELKKVLAESQYIVLAKVDQMYPDKPAMILTVGEDLKGKSPFRRLPTNLKGDAEAEKLKHVPQLLSRLGPDLPLVLFINHSEKNKYISFAYTNGTWFQMVGVKSGDNVVWNLTHGEPYLRRTFKGTTDEMKQTVQDVLKGKKRPPAFNEKEAPGFGPELKQK
jgi:hypothetical protein